MHPEDINSFIKMIEEALKACRFISRRNNWKPLGQTAFSTQSFVVDQHWDGVTVTNVYRAEVAYGILRWLVDLLRPNGKPQWHSRHWRPYLLVTYIYFSGWTFGQVAKKCDVTEAALYFTRRKALEVMASQLQLIASAETNQSTYLDCAQTIVAERFGRLPTDVQQLLKKLAAVGTPLEQQQIALLSPSLDKQNFIILSEEKFLLQGADSTWTLRPYLQAIVEKALTKQERAEHYAAAAKFHLASNAILHAITCWCQAQDPSQAIALMVAHAELLIQQGQGQLLKTQSRQLLKATLTEDEQAQVHLVLGAIAVQNNNFSEAMRTYGNALTASSIPIRARAYYRYANVLRRKNIDTALVAYCFSAELLEQSQKEQALLLTIYLEQAHIYTQEQNALELAEQTLAKANAVIRAGDLIQVARLHDLLGTLHGRKGDDIKSIMHYEQAHAAALGVHDYDLRSRIMHNLGMAYTWAGRYKDGKDSIKSAIKLAQQRDDQQMLASCHKTLGVNHFFQKEFTSAIIEYEIAYKLFEELGNLNWLAALACDLTEAYASLANHEMANFYYEVADKLINKSRTVSLWQLLNSIAAQFPHILPIEAQLNPRQKIGMAYIKQNGLIDRRTYAKLVITSPKTAQRDLIALVEQGILVRSGKGRNVSYRQVSLPFKT